MAIDFTVKPLQPQYGLYSPDLKQEILGQGLLPEVRSGIFPLAQQLASQQLQLFGDTEVGFLIPLWRRLLFEAT